MISWIKFTKKHIDHLLGLDSIRKKDLKMKDSHFISSWLNWGKKINPNMCFMKMFVFLCSLACTIPLQAQDFNQLYRLAQEYEEAGRLKEARQLYESMIADNPDNMQVFQRLKDLYLRTFAFNDANALIESQLKRQPGQPSLEIDLAEVQYRMGNEEEAFAKFQSILDKNSQSSSVYQMVASTYTNEHLYDRAIETYLLGRKKTDNPTLFAISLSQLYAAQQHFDLASEELINYYKQNPRQYAYIESQFLKFPKSTRVLKQLAPPVQKAIQESPDQILLYQLLAKLYKFHEAYDDAFKTFQILESKTAEKNQGNHLMEFGEDVFVLGKVDEAKQAFQEVLTSYPQFKMRDQALLGLSKCYEAEGEIEKTIQTYQQIVKDFPDRIISKFALLHIGRLQRDRLFDVETATKTFESVIRQSPDTPEAFEAQLDLAQCYIILGDTSSTRPLLLKNIKHRITEQPGLQLQAVYLLAQLYYFQGDYDHSLAWLDSLASNKWNASTFQHPIVNDGLQLRFFIQQFYKQRPVLLKYFSHADFLSFQRDYESALTAIDSVLFGRINQSIQAYALFKKGELYTLLNQPKNSLKSFHDLLSRFPNHLLADHALERCGYLYEKMNNPESALEQYELLLTNYPQSLFSDDIRNRIRNLEKK